jgi:hypothetical protein
LFRLVSTSTAAIICTIDKGIQNVADLRFEVPAPVTPSGGSPTPPEGAVFNAGGVSVLLVPPLLARNIVLIGPGTLKTLASSLRTTAVQREKSNAERNRGTYSYDFHSTLLIVMQRADCIAYRGPLPSPGALDFGNGGAARERRGITTGSVPEASAPGFLRLMFRRFLWRYLPPSRRA